MLSHETQRAMDGAESLCLSPISIPGGRWALPGPPQQSKLGTVRAQICCPEGVGLLLGFFTTHDLFVRAPKFLLGELLHFIVCSHDVVVNPRHVSSQFAIEYFKPAFEPSL